MKSVLAGKTLTAKTFKRAVRTLSADPADTFKQWHHRCEKCVAIGGSDVDKT